MNGAAKMIYVYGGLPSDRRCKHTIEWLERHHLDYVFIQIKKVNERQLKALLALSDSGFEELLVPRYKSNKKNLLIYDTEMKEPMRVNDLLRLILHHPSLLKTPIISDGKKIMVGYNGEEIRKFLPRLVKSRNGMI